MPISQRISQQMQKSSWIRRMFEQGTEMRVQYGEDNVFDFTLGNPSMEPPAAFKEALRAVVNDPTPGQHRYMPNAGFPWVRDAIARAVGKEHGVPLEGRHVVMATGAASALNLVLKALLDPGDEVICLAPYFVEYLFYVDNHGGESVVVSADQDFQIDLDRITEALTPKTKAIILNSPNNPTGVMYPAERLQALAERLEEHEARTGRPIYVLLDEPYRRLLYDGQKAPPSLAIFRNGIYCTSHAKDLSIPGERIGYLCVNPAATDADALLNACAFTIRILGFVNAPAVMQRVVAQIQNESIDVDHYRRRRDLFLDGLTDMGYECVRPQGAFYLFPKTPIPDDMEFVRRLMEHRILAVPGTGFGCAGYIRLAYCVPEDTIRRSLPLFEKALSQSRS